MSGQKARFSVDVDSIIWSFSCLVETLFVIDDDDNNGCHGDEVTNKNSSIMTESSG